MNLRRKVINHTQRHRICNFDGNGRHEAKLEVPVRHLAFRDCCEIDDRVRGEKGIGKNFGWLGRFVAIFP
jgi:hypothetical protein